MPAYRTYETCNKIWAFLKLKERKFALDVLVPSEGLPRTDRFSILTLLIYINTKIHLFLKTLFCF